MVKMYEKLIVIDEETVIDGSTNWTSNESVEDFNRLFDLYGEDNVKMALKG